MNSLESASDILVFAGRLRFPPDLESAYRQDYNARLIRIARPGIILSILVYLSFWILDIFALPEAYQSIWLIRLVGIVLIVCLFAISFSPYYQRHVVFLFTVTTAVISLSIIACFALTQPGELVYNLYFITLIFVILGAPALGLPFRNELVIALLTLIAYLVTGIAFLGLFFDKPATTQLIANLFFLVGASTIGLVGSFLTELNNRRDFLLQLAIERERRRSESLLLNVLPKPIAERLKRGETVADFFPNASVLFADMVGFTPLSANLSPHDLVDLLNQVFTTFDVLTEKYGLEKIKTIGDCYMVAAGVPEPREDHARVLVNLALDMQEFISQTYFPGQHKLSLRIGINSGPLIAGIIGKKKFIYDLWGDSVNTASRMESYGREGSVQITASTYELIKGDFHCEPLGILKVKGKDDMAAWLVTGRQDRSN